MNIIHIKVTDNPSVKDISYLMLRSCEKETVFVSVIEAHRPGESVIADVKIECTSFNASVSVTEKDEKTRRFLV